MQHQNDAVAQLLLQARGGDQQAFDALLAHAGVLNP